MIIAARTRAGKSQSGTNRRLAQAQNCRRANRESDPPKDGSANPTLPANWLAILRAFDGGLIRDDGLLIHDDAYVALWGLPRWRERKGKWCYKAYARVGRKPLSCAHRASLARTLKRMKAAGLLAPGPNGWGYTRTSAGKARLANVSNGRQTLTGANLAREKQQQRRALAA
jgi:hypothetical protein